MRASAHGARRAMPTSIDQVQLNFNAAGLVTLNLILGLVMFGVALDLTIEDFRRVVRSPKGPAIGLTAQFVLLPALTFLLTQALELQPSLALGMILVASCPGGNISNFITHLAKGSTALSIGMTAVSTALAIVMTPLNLSFWGSLDPATAAILHEVSLSPVEVLVTVLMILGVPLVLGMTVAAKLPRAAARMRGPFKVLSIVFFLGFVVIALQQNWSHFLVWIGLVMGLVALHNASALALGYGAARLLGCGSRDARAVSLEVGIQNSGFGLVLIFTFFGGLGGMAIIAAWWGVWHIIAGMSLATFWYLRDRRLAAARGAERSGD
jgi:bile acid:Na+ symporter, BASS family